MFMMELIKDFLAIEISQGLREEFIPGTPDDYVNIYTECWDNEPDKRPDMNQVADKLNAMITKRNMITEKDQINKSESSLLLSGHQDLRSINNILHAIFQVESFKQLQEYCFNYICRMPETLFNLSDFLKLEERILLELIKREDIQIDEIELWNYLVKWGIAQTSELNEKDVTDLDSWNEEDFVSLKNSLNQVITNIRFFEIPSKCFYNKIMPFKKVLPEALVEEILSFQMSNSLPNQIILAPRHGRITIDSTVINLRHAAILNNWIQNKSANAKILNDSKYSFKLIYRGSRDGYDFIPVSSLCEGGQRASILIIKIRDNETILGGFNPLGWKYNISNDGGFFYQWDSTNESFIFSFKRDFKISRVINRSKAIYQSSYVFGFGDDLVINHHHKCGTCNNRDYKRRTLDIISFNFEEMEIFEIIKG
ncbi:16417_t:CDS:2 [Funneliformis geosporum]|uniref:16417_t:CDS:1 n=1 Tax=Funneliformis geosporum TaxID=1117311 RepID=A0A9W4WHW0_9GLOM|nr:16417_t:CDS:2 [Funneliformis geosporum]